MTPPPSLFLRVADYSGMTCAVFAGMVDNDTYSMMTFVGRSAVCLLSSNSGFLCLFVCVLRAWSASARTVSLLRIPPLSGDYGQSPGLGLLRLHSTFRHDLKIYASDEGRVQMTAAAFAKVS